MVSVTLLHVICMKCNLSAQIAHSFYLLFSIVRMEIEYYLCSQFLAK